MPEEHDPSLLLFQGTHQLGVATLFMEPIVYMMATEVLVFNELCYSTLGFQRRRGVQLITPTCMLHRAENKRGASVSLLLMLSSLVRPASASHVMTKNTVCL